VIRRLPASILVRIVLVAVCAIGGVAGRTLAGERRLGGPLWMDPDGHSAASIPVDLDQRGVIGVSFAGYPLPEGIVFEGAHLLGSQPWMNVRIALGSCPIGAVRESTSACPGERPVVGSRTGPGIGDLRLLVHLGLTETGAGGFAGVVVDYRVGDHHYEAIYVQGGIICAPSTDDCDKFGQLSPAQDRLVQQVERLSGLVRD
jgi:hypothetical protein